MTASASASHGHIYAVFARWTSFCYRHGAWVLLASLLTVAACGVYVARNLGMNTDTADMLSEHLPFRVNLKHYNQTFPQDMDTLLVVLDAPAPEQAHLAAEHLAERLRTDPGNFHDVYPPTVNSFFARNGLLYLSVPELEQITDSLAQAQPLIAYIATDPTLPAFASVLTGAVEELGKGRSLELQPVLAAVQTTLDARLAGSPRVLSWQALFHGGERKKTYQELIVIKPRLDYSQMFPAEQSIAALHAAAEEIGITDAGPVRMRITGEVALAEEELNSSLRGMESAGVITFLLVVIVLYFAMRTPGLILNVLLCLGMGLVLTAAFATAAVGHLNLISIAFAVLYIGLGADFAIHFLLRYREILKNGLPPTGAVYVSGGDAGAALTACTITNAIGFYAFIPTDYSGVAELGIISGTGMIISLLVTLTLGPALLRYSSGRLPDISGTKASVGRMLEWSLRWHRLTYAVAAVAAIAAVLLLPQVRFDYNLLNLQDQTGQAVKTFRELLADPDQSPWHAVALASGSEETQRLVQRLAELPEVSKVVTILDFVPAEQEVKMGLIEDVALTMGPIQLSERVRSETEDASPRQRQALEELAAALDRFVAGHAGHAAAAVARPLAASLRALFVRLDAASVPERRKLLADVEDDMLMTLPNALRSLRAAMEAAPFEEQDLPEALSRRWRSPTGEYRLAVYPAENLDDNTALRHFVRAVLEVAPNATGAPMIGLEAGEAVVQAFIHAFLLALLGIIVALLIILRSVKYTLLVLIPLLLSSLFTAAFTILLNVPFNFANIIALPLLLGLGIDSSLHMVHRSLNNEMVSEVLIHTSTARAIFYSALTALVDFASLMFSAHDGTASIGIMLTVGLAFTLICTLVILPAILRAPARRAGA